jgi:class 3 adenylate cyclase/tetratricopeptide (TPR) repeat protein
MAVPETATPVDFTPFVPRVVLDWLRDSPGVRRRDLPGTLAFVDISGFTAMSERLAQKGKLGAEEVTDVMNFVFARLLDVAYAYGGGLLKFGGDALLLFFSDGDHATHACDASFGMRKALRDLGHPETSVGPVTLKMHVGIHSDSFDFFLVGESHRELLLAGRGVTTTVEMEGGAEAGEILVSEATAAGLPARLFGEAKAGGRLLKAAPGAPAEPAPTPPLEGIDIGRCVPAPVRTYLEGGRGEPEHRQASVAFVHVGSVDALLAEDADGAAEALEEIVVSAQRIAEEHGVTFLETDIDKDGAKMILVAGAPQTEGEDEERLLRTVLGIAEGPGRLPLRMGLTRGRVFAGEVGAQFRRTYTILGKTAALAARLMMKAEAGQILTTADFLERCRGTFETTELEPFQLKGIEGPVTALDVHGVVATVEAAPEAHVPFVGRERELAIVSAALGPVRMGFGNMVELIGEPGLGKSRLVEELQERAPDLRTLTATCEQYEASTPYFAFRGVLRSLLELPSNGAAPSKLRGRIEELDPDLLPWLPLVAMPLDLEVDQTKAVDDLQPAFRRARLHGVIESLFSKLLATPTLLIVEDAHWMDEASSELLRHLGTQVSSKPWLICVTRRPVDDGFSAAGGVPPIAAMTIQLQPLSDEESRELIGAAAEAMPRHEIAAITDRAGGNPLFLQELITSSGAPEEEALPESVEAVIATRIDKLPTGDRALLRYAAVLGATFSADLVTNVLAEDPAASADSEAWDRLGEFLERDPYTPGAFRFRHALFRDAAYEGLSYKRRGELHAKVGEAYERLELEGRGEFAELLSLHFFHAAEHAKTYRYSLLAGERAQAKYANVEAAAFYRRALEVAPKLADQPDGLSGVWESLGDVSELAGLYTDAADAYSHARKLDAHPRLLLKEGIIRERFSRYSDALRWYNRGLRSLEGLDPEEQRRMRRELSLAYAGVRVRQGEFLDGAAWCKRVVDEEHETLDLGALAHAYHLMHLAYISVRSPERAAFRGLALPIYEELGDLLGQANALNNLGVDAYYEGRWQEALDAYDRSKALRERIGDVVGAATITNNIGEIKSDQGYLTTACELFDDAREVFETSGHRMLATLALSNLGRAAAREGRRENALKMLREALAAFHEIRAGSLVIETKTRLAELAVFSHDPEEALHQADETLAAIEQSGGGSLQHALVHRLRGYALMQQGDLDGAAGALEESLKVARSADETYELAVTLEASARLAELRGDDGSAQAKESKGLLARLGVVSTPEIPFS